MHAYPFRYAKVWAPSAASANLATTVESAIGFGVPLFSRPNTMSKAIAKTSRHFTAAALIICAALLAFFSFADRSQSANPENATINPAGPNVNWTGTSTGGFSLDESTCDPLDEVNCDTFALTISGQPADWAGKKVRVTVNWPNAGDDYDVFIHKGPVTGPVVGSSAQGGAGPEVIDLDPNIASVGTGVFSVRVVYWLVAPPAEQYTAVASVQAGAAPTPSPTPGGSATPTQVNPGVPRYVNHYAPPGVMEDAGEPTMGVNWKTENVARPAGSTNFKNTNRNGSQNQTLNGGTSMYYGGINSYFLRATFDDCSSPAATKWDQIPLVIANTTRGFYDPLMYTDHWTGRTWVMQEFGLTPGGSSIEFTDNDGDTMHPSEGGAPSGGIDHQTLAGGPFHAPTPPTVITPKVPPDPAATPYPHAVYYASQNIASATSQLSVDGGFTYPVQAPMFTANECAGLHGHLKIAEDGTVFLPDKACGDGVQPPLLFGGNPAVVVSENNGATWQIRRVPNAASDAGVDDPSVGVSWCPGDMTCTAAEKAARSNHIYLGFMYADGRPGIAYSNNKGQNWVRVTDLGALTGIKHVAFPAVAVGDPDRAAFTFIGTTTQGNYSAPEFPGIWHQYIAQTFDYGQTWIVQNISPEGPIQRGGICGDGTCRNLLDFIDIQIDKRGRILIAGEDGCIGGCELGGANSFTAKAFISRQSGGKRMFSLYDNDSQVDDFDRPILPGAPTISGNVDAGNTRVTLSWPVPDHGGSAITAYKVYRSNAQSGPWGDDKLIATVTEPRFIDTSFPAGDKFYVVTALNAVGESPYCKVFAPLSGPVATPCTLPGLLVNSDVDAAGADTDAPQQVPADPRVNVRQLYVAEPFVGASEPLVFTMQVAPSTSTTAPPNSQWLIIWNRQGTHPADGDDADYDRLYVAMVTDAAGTPTFEYGKFGIPINTSPPPPPDPNANAPKRYGQADNGSYNPTTGLIRITVAKSKFRAIDNAAGTNDYGPNTSLSATNVRTYFNRPDYISDPASAVRSQRSQNNASDITGDATYTMAGNQACAPQAELLRAFSRKQHAPSNGGIGTTGTFDIQLFPQVNGIVPIEPRRGGTPGNHQVVMVFPAPVTFTGVSASNGASASTSPAPNSAPTSEVVINLTNVPNAQTISVNLAGVSAGAASSTITVQLRPLLGDVNVDGNVNSGDPQQVRNRSGQLVENDNFRDDVNLDGVVNSGDAFVVRGQSGTGF